MPKRYEEIATARSARLTRSARHAREMFGRASDEAMRVVGLRERLGMSQAELAERCGVRKADIRPIERGVARPGEEALQRIAEALGEEQLVSNIRQTNRVKQDGTGSDSRVQKPPPTSTNVYQAGRRRTPPSNSCPDGFRFRIG